MKYQISRISILQSSKVVVCLYGLIGMLYFLVGLGILIFGGAQLFAAAVFYMLMPVLMVIFGFLLWCLFAWLYNVVAKMVGGIELELKQMD